MRIGYLQAKMGVPVSIYAIEVEGSDGLYVGATSNPVQLRLSQHIRDAFSEGRNRLPKHAWLRTAAQENKQISVVELERVPAGLDWQASESFWIESLSFMGANMLNATSGGLGQPGYQFTDEHRQKIAESKLGVKRDPKFTAPGREAALAVNTGNHRSEQTKKKISDALKQHKRTPEHGRAISDALRRRHAAKR